MGPFHGKAMLLGLLLHWLVHSIRHLGPTMRYCGLNGRSHSAIDGTMQEFSPVYLRAVADVRCGRIEQFLRSIIRLTRQNYG